MDTLCHTQGPRERLIARAFVGLPYFCCQEAVQQQGKWLNEQTPFLLTLHSRMYCYVFIGRPTGFMDHNHEDSVH